MVKPDLKQAIFDARGRTGYHIDAVHTRDGKLYQVRVWKSVVTDEHTISDPLTPEETSEYLAQIK